ncbi:MULTISPECIES: CaiB/BaiF CoA-transferase family protein [unclassified Chelatococcus]|uniref:CaiB/BaiF CoA transferase family protein n=1 Tax=unclassified Chelatococcus TaxID=2638111 RepID=UPI001BCAD49A|nr:MULTISPECIES: CaiB/BaiF CoA-transferase family protein [unclassified Chelatococcus]MBS7701365.1 CoA transferase [Chelatococcus sp. YT9]MBX3557445.1 CoA transferase [Chelatococcus sp.]
MVLFSSKLPLEGKTVVELGHSLAAPYAGHILAHLGAQVIKIEPAGSGDYARDWGVASSGGMAVMFHAINCGKKSIVADLRDTLSVQRLKRFIFHEADIVVQNMKAGTVERIGLDAQTLRAKKPGLIYCNISAFGQVGPLRDAPGYDPLVQAVSGLMSLTGNPGGEPVRVPVSLNDMGSGMWSVIGILSACLEQERSGFGRTIDTSLYETSLAWITVQLSDYLASGELPGKHGSGNANIVPYQSFRCLDGELLIAAGNDRLFRALCVAIDMPEYGTDPLYATNSARIRNKPALVALLQAAIAKFPVAELERRLEANGVPAGPINTIATSAASPQTEALGIIEKTPGDGVQIVGIPLSFDGVRPPVAGRSPKLGEHVAILGGQDATEGA